MVILDTNVISALMRAEPDPAVVAWLDRQSPISVWTSAVTVMELSFGLEVMPEGKRRSLLRQQLEQILDDILEHRVVAFDSNAARQAALLMAKRQISGQTGEVRDSMIAGTAIARRATLATRNTRHFAGLPITVVDPWTSINPR